MQSASNVSLASLRPGHEFPGASINARKQDRLAGIPELAASIVEEGVLQSLLIVEAPDNGDNKKKIFYVANGNRRLAALLSLVKTKKIAADAMVPAIVSDEKDPVKALRKSLATAMQHVSLHPVDHMEAFLECRDKGDTPEKIAARYVLPVKIVKQRLALASLSPVIREAWRKGKLTMEAAKAYAATAHHGAQEKQFKRGTYESTNPHSIRSALIGDKQEIDKFLKFVTPEAYKGAGGKISEDLFGDKEGATIADLGLLKKLAEDKLNAKAADFVKAGWGWASIDDDLPSDHYSWARKSIPSADEKKKLGVVLDIDYNGALKTVTGVAKPGTKGVAKDAPEKAKAKSPNALSNALKDRLENWRWLAIQTALKTDTYPAGITDTLAEIVCELIRPYSRNHNPPPIARSFRHLVDGLHDEALQGALLKHFVPKEYFPKAPKATVIKAIAEAGWPDEAKKLAAGTKSKAWHFALSNLAKTGWLPPELRLGNYAGPEAGKPAKKKAKR